MTEPKDRSKTGRPREIADPTGLSAVVERRQVEALREAAWQQRVSMSAVTREVIAAGMKALGIETP